MRTSIMIPENVSGSGFLRPDIEKALHALMCSSLLPLAGIIDIEPSASGARRNLIWVTKRVQRPLSRGKGRPVCASRTELLPLD